ncbi:DUF2889 domain-containing protein [Roseospira marina]|uniref:DUF2889 domain-containing protein n=1 Tax=Roseospira marina TaxID=140057 RepID=A0A5M6ICV3_9PROT|nr:DUF2889 domain-containing protein [Roseospira marina]KAA5605565.1 DUF2889 domain-containing protein [Roseospira marina]MBB4313372.1 hypothetical protein [Roseospira marina]MBB5085887.1 hypothetical protein [Roseospira marina]
MPLSKPAPRTHIHTRRIECHGFQREDGLWDIEGRIVDTKAYTFTNHDRGHIAAGEALHDMVLRVTVDDDLVIQAVEAVTDSAPFHICAEVTPNFQRLVGLTIGAGFTGQVRQRLGRGEGCTHLVDLLKPLAATAYQTLHFRREEKRRAANTGERPRILDTCYALRSDGPIVAREWPEFHTKPE